MNSELSVEQKSHLGRIAAKQFLLITDCWKITDNERRVLAGAATRTTISTWRKRVKTRYELQLGNDTYERLICIGDIHRSLLKSMNEDDIAEYIRKPLNPFETNLLDKMLNGWMLDLYQVKTLISDDPTLNPHHYYLQPLDVQHHTQPPI